MSLPPPLFNFASQNEDASAERLLLEILGPSAKAPLRIACVCGCGTNAITMCASPDVGQVDVVDVAPAQLQLGALLRTAVEVLGSPEELAVFIGNSGEGSERAAMYPRVGDQLDVDLRAYWDSNLETVTAGIINCGGAERCYASTREHLPSSDLAVLANEPSAVLAALRAALSMENQRANMMIPEAAMRNIAEHGVPAIAAQLSGRLTECSAGPPDFLVELILRGRFAMEPVGSRPRFLQPEVFAEIQQNGCGPDRLSFHEGPLQTVASALADKDGSYDIVIMSNILDMSPPDEAEASVRAVATAVRPGGVLLCRSHQPAGSLATVFARAGLKVDDDLSRRVRAAETSFFMNDVCVATA